MLKLHNLEVELAGRRLLGPLNLQCSAGQIVGLVGRNGAGKSTLLKTLAGLLPYRGQLHWDEHELSGLGPQARAEQLAYVAQLSSLDQPFRGFELVAMGCYIRLGGWGALTASERSWVQECLQRCGATHLADKLVTQISGGELQRLRLAQALAQKSRWLLLDEPTSALDLAQQLEISQLLQELAGEGRGLLVALHDLNWARRICQQIWLLSEGQCLLQGPPEGVLTSNQFQESYRVQLDSFQGPQDQQLFWPRQIDA